MESRTHGIDNLLIHLPTNFEYCGVKFIVYPNTISIDGNMYHIVDVSKPTELISFIPNQDLKSKCTSIVLESVNEEVETHLTVKTTDNNVIHSIKFDADISSEGLHLDSITVNGKYCTFICSKHEFYHIY